MFLTHLVLFGFIPGAGGVVTPAQSFDPIPGAGSGKRKDWKKLKQQELKRLLEVLGEEPETAVQVARIKAEHTKPAVFVDDEEVEPPKFDAAGLARDIQAIQWLLNAYAELEARQRERARIELEQRLFLMQEDEAAFMLLM